MEQSDQDKNLNISSIKVKEQVRGGSIQNIYIPTSFRAFLESQLNNAITQFVYGSEITLHIFVDGKVVSEKGVLCFNFHLTLLFPNELFTISLQDIQQILVDQALIPTPPKDQINYQNFLVINLKNIDATYFIEFNNHLQRDWVHQALQHFLIIDYYNLQFKNQIRYVESQIYSNYGNSKSEFSKKDIQKLLWKLKIYWTNDFIDQLFFKDVKDKKVKWDDLNAILTQQLVKQEVKEIFETYSPTRFDKSEYKGQMTKEQFQTFLVKEQHLYLEEEDVSDIFLSLNDKNEEFLSFIAFSEFLFSSVNEIVDIEQLRLDDALDRSLQNYYINSAYKIFQTSSSTGSLTMFEQYSSYPEGVQPLIYVLLRGVRHIELEFWEGPNQDPICIYGPMQNLSVTLLEILKVIKVFAFQTTQQPLIIHVEDHCGKAIKQMISDQFKQVLGNLIEFVHKAQYQTLRQLEGKILLSGPVRTTCHLSPSYTNVGMIDTKSKQITQDDVDEGISSKANNISFYVKKGAQLQLNTTRNFSNHLCSTESRQGTPVSSPGKIQKSHSNHSSIIQKLTHSEKTLRNNLLIIGFQEKFKFYQLPLGVPLKDQCLIYETSDLVFNQLLDSRKQRLRQGNSETYSSQSDNCLQMEQKIIKENSVSIDYFVKWYPSSIVQDNLNLSSSQTFLLGIQFSMIMHHVIDFNYMYHYAMFRGVDGVQKGYISKPNLNIYATKRGSASLQSDYNMSIPQSVGQNSIKFLKIKLISGRNLFPKRLAIQNKARKLFVQVILRNPILCDQEKIQQNCTQSRKEQGAVFTFEQEFVFELMQQNFYSVLMFVVYEAETQNFICWNSFNVPYIKEGYKVVPLLDEFLNRIHNSSLFVKIQLE